MTTTQDKDPRQVILRPIISERSYDLINHNRYTFEVAKTANKVEIGQAVESIFDVKVLSVNTINVSGKRKRVRYAWGYTRSWKKAIVTLAEGNTIEAFGV
ncbi:MAG: 50S ribosomal protein L23 [Actinomycetia bacterium]|nr:50S ribosomal protein L23 [Actinomycetes bacterium]